MKKVLIILFAFIAFTAKSQIQINQKVAYQGDSLISCYTVVSDVQWVRTTSQLNFHIVAYSTKAKFTENPAYIIDIPMIPQYLSLIYNESMGTDGVTIAKNYLKTYLLQTYDWWSATNIILE